jgi:hypothetical protein
LYGLHGLPVGYRLRHGDCKRLCEDLESHLSKVDSVAKRRRGLCALLQSVALQVVNQGGKVALEKCLVVDGSLGAKEGWCDPGELRKEREICDLGVEEADNSKVTIEFVYGLVRGG